MKDLERKLKNHATNVKFIDSARIPIVKSIDNETGMECDITTNSILGIANSALLNSYARCDQRFHILGFFIKKWAKISKVHGGDKQLLTSYAFLNMLINFLQMRKPPVSSNPD